MRGSRLATGGGEEGVVIQMGEALAQLVGREEGEAGLALNDGGDLAGQPDEGKGVGGKVVQAQTLALLLGESAGQTRPAGPRLSRELLGGEQGSGGCAVVTVGEEMPDGDEQLASHGGDGLVVADAAGPEILS